MSRTAQQWVGTFGIAAKVGSIVPFVFVPQRRAVESPRQRSSASTTNIVGAAATDALRWHNGEVRTPC